MHLACLKGKMDGSLLYGLPCFSRPPWHVLQIKVSERSGPNHSMSQSGTGCVAANTGEKTSPWDAKVTEPLLLG